MKLRTKDQIHISSVSPNTMGKGTEFEVSDAMGRELLKAHPDTIERAAPAEDQAQTMTDDDRPAARRGRRTEDETAPMKAEPAPANKAEQPPPNKAAPKRG